MTLYQPQSLFWGARAAVTPPPDGLNPFGETNFPTPSGSKFKFAVYSAGFFDIPDGTPLVAQGYSVIVNGIWGAPLSDFRGLCDYILTESVKRGQPVEMVIAYEAPQSIVQVPYQICPTDFGLPWGECFSPPFAGQVLTQASLVTVWMVSAVQGPVDPLPSAYGARPEAITASVILSLVLAGVALWLAAGPIIDRFWPPRPGQAGLAEQQKQVVRDLTPAGQVAQAADSVSGAVGQNIILPLILGIGGFAVLLKLAGGGDGGGGSNFGNVGANIGLPYGSSVGGQIGYGGGGDSSSGRRRR